MMTPITIDFEASCLPSDGMSFPIEVGIADGISFSRSWLIRPDPRWHDWCWTTEAESLHGISRAQLDAEGLPAELVLDQLRRAVGDRMVVADSYLDAYWLGALCDAAGADVPFAITHVSSLLDQWSPTSARAAFADLVVAGHGFRPHRAGEDAKRLALWLAAVDARSGAGAGERADSAFSNQD